MSRPLSQDTIDRLYKIGREASSRGSRFLHFVMEPDELLSLLDMAIVGPTPENCPGHPPIGELTALACKRCGGFKMEDR